MMQFIFKKWQEKLTQFESNVDKGLAEIRKCKADIQKMRQEADFELHKGRYIHDDERIILSAPEIIIGHVDRNGLLIDGGSTVIVRGSQIGLQGVGEGGQLEMRASGIRQIAEDPGIDGEEHVVGNRSEVVSLARHIVIHSQDAEGVFPMEPPIPSGPGVRIHADKTIEVDASAPGPEFKKTLHKLIGDLEQTQKMLKTQSASHKSTLDQMTSSMEELLKEKEWLMNKQALVRAAYGDIEKVNDYIEQLSLSLSQEVCQYAKILSQLAETSRQMKSIKEQISKIKEGDDFWKKSTGASVAVTGEVIRLESKGEETEADKGKIRENKEAMINISGRCINLSTAQKDNSLLEDSQVTLKAKNVLVDQQGCKNANDKNGELESAEYPVEGTFTLKSKNIYVGAVDQVFKDGVIKDKGLGRDGRITLLAQHIDVDTSKIQNTDYDTDGNQTKGEYLADGEVTINSKTITMGAVDSEFDANEPHQRKETALSKGSEIQMRTERINMQATTTDGKATGGIRMNAKDLEMLSVDIGRDNLALTKDGVMAVMSERIYLGYSKDDSLKSHKVQAWADKITLLGSKVVQAIQGKKDKKKVGDAAFLQLKEGDAQLKGKATEIHGSTKLVGSLDAPQVSVGDIEIKGELKSNYLGGGVTAGPPPKSDLKLDDVSQEDYELFEQYSD